MEDKKLNPNKVLDWTLGALTCKSHQENFEGTKLEACGECPIVCPSLNKVYETLTPESCKMFDNVVMPLLLAGVPVKEKDKEVYNHFVKTGTSEL